VYVGEAPVIQERYEGSVKTETRFNLTALMGGDLQIAAQYKKVYGGAETLSFFYFDQIGSRRVVLDDAGTVQDRFQYSPWGEMSHPEGTQDNLASFTGKEYDATGLLYFNARYYDPTIGRFITEDPSRKGTGWYTYCSNNPVNRSDPTGRYDPDDPNRGQPAPSPATTQPGQTQESAPSAAPSSYWAATPEAVAQAMSIQGLIAYRAQPVAAGVGLLWPTESRRVTASFGPEHPLGIDIGPLQQGVAGDVVRAIGGGTVTTAGNPDWSPSGSSYVIIQGAGGREYRYAHMGEINVAVGDVVDQRQQIGSMGDVGAAGQIHLHFEIRQAGTAIDPFPLFVP
jgi:RHS repeat-associated protein